MPDSHETNPPCLIARLPEDLETAPLRLFFGGSFDPPHLGHVSLPGGVTAQLGVPSAPILFVPAARSPHKADVPTPSFHRLAMLGLALDKTRNAWIWSEEIDRAERDPDIPSYWATTWEIVRDRYPNGRNRFLIGADQAVSMHRWYRFESIWQDAVVILRDEHDDPELLMESLGALGVWDEDQLEHWRAQVCAVPVLDVSSTQVRNALRDPATRENPIAGLDDRVHEYILKHRLYTPA